MLNANAKRIALFLDGTWNIEDNNTNVWRLNALCQTDNTQVSYYSAGVGTQYGEKVSGGMFGWGLDKEVVAAYEWLIANYNPGDQIFIFGFSRGAYTARSLSGFISKCGLLQAGAPIGVGELYDRYRQLKNDLRTIRELARDKDKPNNQFTWEEKWMLEYSAPVPIKFIGVWDTVGALGVPFGNIPIISRSNYRFLETDLRINNDYAYHALAIDEHRAAFAPTLWTSTTPKNAQPADIRAPRKLSDVEQRWFIGAHANVGGGYSSDLLAQIPLKWMMNKAILHGLKFRRDVIIDGDENAAPLIDSRADFAGGIYRFVSPNYYRPIGIAPNEVKPAKADDPIMVTNTINETIDASVFERWRKDPKYRPPNLVQWAKNYSVNVEQLQGSVRADQPSVIIPDDVIYKQNPPI